MGTTLSLLVSSIPRKFVDRILSGGVIDFYRIYCLRWVVCVAHRGRVTQSLHLNFPPICVEDEPLRNRYRHVYDLTIWLEAWTIYLTTILQAAPQRTRELLAYQGLIIEANRRLYPEACLEYDQHFPQLVARLAACHDRSCPTQMPRVWKDTPSMLGRCRFRPSQGSSSINRPDNHQLRPSPAFTSNNQATDLHQGRHICRPARLTVCFLYANTQKWYMGAHSEILVRTRRKHPQPDWNEYRVQEVNTGYKR